MSSLTLDLIDKAQLIKQGAEARVYKLPADVPLPLVRWPNKLSKDRPVPSTSTSDASPSSSSEPAPSPTLLKYRFAKQYRHPTLDSTLTKSRILAESRALLKCSKNGVRVPAIKMIDLDGGMIGLEWIEGWSVREVLGGGAEGEEGYEETAAERQADGAGEEEEEEQRSDAERALESLGLTPDDLMASLGKTLAAMHSKEIIHGDLTTSNIMLRPLTKQQQTGSLNYEIVLIDFGLSSVSQLAENIAVDLYVLERAFASTHPESEGLYAKLLDAYADSLGKDKWKQVGGRLADVRLRGRKRDMTG